MTSTWRSGWGSELNIPVCAPGRGGQRKGGAEVSGRDTLETYMSDNHQIGIRINSDWRCPDGNRAVGGVPTSDHMQGTAGDFTASGFDVGMWEKFEEAAMDVAGARQTSGFKGGKPENRRGRNRTWNYSSYIHIDW